MKKQIVVIAHNIRSAHNIGSILRTSDGLGVKHVYLTGYSPYPISKNDSRLPHLAKKTNQRISKTSLGAEKSDTWSHYEDVDIVLSNLKRKGFTIAALDQGPASIDLMKFDAPLLIALLLGSEVDGIDRHLLQKTDIALEIPMAGKKDSFNVAIAAAIAIYHLSQLQK